MTERYDSVFAQHYAAYRPPLHGPILARVIQPGERFAFGIDVGCGAGNSSVVLVEYCDRVCGVDPSPSMLASAQKHLQIEYVLGTGGDLSFVADHAANVVTFAGSLHYAKSPALRTELNRVCCPGGVVIAYDFEVLLDSVLASLGVEIPAVASDYDHAANIADWPEFAVEVLKQEEVELNTSAQQLSHVLLADSNRYEALSAKLGSAVLFEQLVDRLESASSPHGLNANIYYSRYVHSPPS